MSIAIASGISAGLVAGAALGVTVEHLTRPDPNENDRYEEWNEQFEAEFGSQVRADERRNREMNRRIDAWMEDHPRPKGISAHRAETYWSVELPKPDGNGERGRHGGWLYGIGIAGIAGGVVHAMFMAGNRADARLFVGARGALALMPVAAAAAYMGGFMVSAKRS